MKIGELATNVGLSSITIRYYESAGVLPRPKRTESNYRMYGAEDVERLQFVKKAKRLGFSLEEIKSILLLHNRGQATCVHVHALLEEKLRRVDALLQEFQEFRVELSGLRDAAATMEDCRSSGGRICAFIERGDVSISDEALSWVEAARGQADSL